MGLEAVSLTVLYNDHENGEQTTLLLHDCTLLLLQWTLGKALVAVGSEDCSICLLRLCLEESLSPRGNCLEVLHTLQGHVSSVKALDTSSSSSGKLLLFSGGARASLKVWSVGKL